MTGCLTPPTAGFAALPPIAPSQGRFIRLGPGQSWAQRAIDTDTLRFGEPDEPHDLCFEGKWDGVGKRLLASGRSAQKASELRRQLHDFYTLGSDVLWVTIAGGRLLWSFAGSEVIDLRGSGDEVGVVARRLQGRWRCRTIYGAELLVSDLAPILSVRGYPGALCGLTKLDAICRAINGL